MIGSTRLKVILDFIKHSIKIHYSNKKANSLLTNVNLFLIIKESLSIERSVIGH